MPVYVRANEQRKVAKPWASASSYPTVIGPLGSTVGTRAPALPMGIFLPGTPTVPFVEEFDTFDTSRWRYHEPGVTGVSGPGFRMNSENWHPVPHDSEMLSVSDSVLTMKTRRRSGLPSQPADCPMTGVLINTQGHYAIPANSTTFIESRQWVPSGVGTFTAFWLVDPTPSYWPRGGEVDITEFLDNPGSPGSRGYKGLCLSTMHWFDQNDYDSGNSNQGHRQAGQRYDPGETFLLDSWHVYGWYRSPSRMELWVDGVKRITWLPNVVDQVVGVLVLRRGQPTTGPVTAALHVESDDHRVREHVRRDTGIAVVGDYVKVWQVA